MIFLLSFFYNFAVSLTWIEPSADLDYHYNQNQGFQDEIGKTYNRFTPRAQGVIRDVVWSLSRNSASISIKFITNSPKIQIQYQREAPFTFPMMNKLGTSGIDLYGYDEHGGMHFFAGSYNLGNTVTFDFSEHNKSVLFSYLLVLPSYDVVKPSTLKFGVEDGSFFEILETELERPIVLYGTSIMHGACPSRPGLSWVNWLSRDLQLPVRNFGFKGQGLLEPDVLNFIIEEEASAYVLDCLPNLVFESIDTVVNLTINSYNQIRAKWPETPIIFVEFGGYTNFEFNLQYRTYTQNMNNATRIARKKLEEQKATNVYFVSYEDLGITSDDISDSVHPMDNGMYKQKNAIEKVLREIFNMPQTSESLPYNTQYPITQHRNVRFAQRHQKILKSVINASKSTDKSWPTKAIIGDSITENWETTGKKSWKEIMEPSGFINLGVGYDRIENALYRVYHDELYSNYIKPEKIIALIGTNNIEHNNQTEIVEGIRFLFKSIQIRQKDAKLTLLGILPRHGFEETVKNINVDLKNIAKEEGWAFSDPGLKLLDEKTGLVNQSLFTDGLHPNNDGYYILAPIIAAL